MTLKRLVDEFCRRCGQQAATLTPDGRIRNWHKCPHDPPGVPNPPKPPMSPDVAVLVPPTCHTCGQPATCFGTYEGITGFGCDDCCGHGCEDGHCEPLRRVVDPQEPSCPPAVIDGLPIANAAGAYFWFRPSPAFSVNPEPQCVFVRWMRGAVRAVFGGSLYKVTAMQGEWAGPILLPESWETQAASGR